MQITINWVNRNVNEDGCRVYRDIAPFDQLTLPETVHAELTGAGHDTYVDATVDRGNTYYYVIETYKGEDVAYSNVIEAKALPRTGPGPQELTKGDWERGYFGTVSSREFLLTEEIAFQVDITEKPTVVESVTWHKFAYKGKVLFVPRYPIMRGMSWKYLYEKGLVYGSDDNGPVVPDTVTATPQDAVVQQRGGERFKVRLFKGAPGLVPEFSLTTVSDGVGLLGSEWTDLMLMLTTHVNAEQRGASWATYSASTFGYSNGYMATLCQELDPTETKPFFRGGTYNDQNEFGAASYLVDGTLDDTSITYISEFGEAGDPVVESGIQHGWRPVLEFIPNTAVIVE